MDSVVPIANTTQREQTERFAHVGEKLRALRERLGRSQREIGEECGDLEQWDISRAEQYGRASLTVTNRLMRWSMRALRELAPEERAIYAFEPEEWEPRNKGWAESA